MDLSWQLKIISQNVNSLQSKYNKYIQSFNSQSLDIILLQETRFTKDSTANNFQFNWTKTDGNQIFLSENNRRGSGGVAVLLNQKCPITNATIHHSTRPGNHLVVQGQLGSELVYIHSIYVPTQGRRQFLLDLPTDFPPDALHIVGGDLNTAIDPSLDSLPNAHPLSPQAALLFSQWAQSLNIQDIWRTIHPNKTMASGPNLKHRLDYLFTSPFFLEGSSPVCYFEEQIVLSDHFQLTAVLANNHLPSHNSFFRAPNWAFRLSEVQRRIDFRLRQNPYDPSRPIIPWFNQFKRTIKRDIKEITIKYTSKYSNTLNSLRAKYYKAQQIFSTDNTIQNRDRYRIASQNLSSFKNNHDLIKHAKALNRKISQDESCTKYFFKRTKRRKLRTYITTAKHPDGTSTSNPSEIHHIFRQFWSKVFTSFDDDPAIDINKQDYLLNLIHNRLQPEASAELDLPISTDEIKEAMKSMAHHKTPGLDGLPIEFYLLHPDLWADLFQKVYNETFLDGRLTSSQRTTAIALLYKKGDPNYPQNYRPISLLNVDAKILTKILTKRLKNHIAHLIPDEQTGFIPGRNIQANLTIIRDLLHIAITAPDTLPDHPALVLLDQQKAYDRVDWAYLSRILQTLGFGPNWIQMIQTIYNQRRAVLIINGELTLPFSVSRGVLQGCPLSPFLYVIQLIPLLLLVRTSASLQRHPQPNLLHYLNGGGSYFADDATLIVQSPQHALDLLEEIKNTYCAGTGARINDTKTNILPLTRIHPYANFFPPSTIIQSNQSVRILGITYGLTLDDSTNFATARLAIYSRAKQILYCGRTLAGRTHLARSLLTAKLMFLLPILHADTKTTKKQNQIENLFINKHTKTSDTDPTRFSTFISSQWIHSSKQNGGLGLRPFHITVRLHRLKQLSLFLNNIGANSLIADLPPHYRPAFQCFTSIANFYGIHPSHLMFIQPPKIRANRGLPWKLIHKTWHSAILELQHSPFSPQLALHPSDGFSILHLPIINNYYLKTSITHFQIWSYLPFKELFRALKQAHITYVHHLYEWRSLNSAERLLHRIRPFLPSTFNLPHVLQTIKLLLHRIQFNIYVCLPPYLPFDPSTPNTTKCSWLVDPSSPATTAITFQQPDLSKWAKAFQTCLPPRPKHPLLENLSSEQLQKLWAEFHKFSRAILPILKDTYWRLQRGLLPVSNSLHWLTETEKSCVFCSRYPETHAHLFFHCSHSQPLWNQLLPLFPFHIPPTDTWELIINPLQHVYPGHLAPPLQNLHKQIWHITVASLVKTIWDARCLQIFHPEEPKATPATMFEKARDQIQKQLIGWCFKQAPHKQQKIIDILQSWCRRDHRLLPILNQIQATYNRPRRLRRNPPRYHPP